MKCNEFFISDVQLWTLENFFFLSHPLFSRLCLRGLLLWRATKTTLLSLIKPQPQCVSIFPPSMPPSPFSLSLPPSSMKLFFCHSFNCTTLPLHSSSSSFSFSPLLLVISQHVSPIIPLPSCFPLSLPLSPWQLSKDISWCHSAVLSQRSTTQDTLCCAHTHTHMQCTHSASMGSWASWVSLLQGQVPFNETRGWSDECYVCECVCVHVHVHG